MEQTFGLKKLRKLLIVTFSILSITAFAQQSGISGTVTSQSGLPLPGVNILQKGTGNGVVTDFDGKYQIKLVSGSRTLVFSYLGFVTQEVAIGDNITLNITLEEDTQKLDEVVVVG